MRSRPARRSLRFAASVAALLGVLPPAGASSPPLPQPDPPRIVPCAEDQVAPQLRRDLTLSCLAAPGGATGQGPVDSDAATSGAWSEAQRDYPIRRNAATLIHDEARGTTILFGGYACPGVACAGLNDTWTLDGERWTRLSPQTSPSPRYASGAAYDAEREEIVLYGGSSCDQLGCRPGGETWTWNGTTWRQESPAHAPPPLYAPAMAYDVANKEVVLFGGCAAACPTPTATWTWDGTDWTPHVEPHVGVNAPAPRYGSGMAYDAARQRTILFGGSDPIGNSVGDTWAWDGSSWSELHPATSPGTRLLPAMAYDPRSSRIVLFGGSARTCTGTCVDTFKNETWTFDGTTWSQVATAAAPPPSNFGAMAFDAATGNLTLAGGQGRTNPDIPVVGSLRSTYTFDGSNWVERPSTIPEERKDASLVHDPVSQLTLMVGGTCIYDPTCGVWAWDGEAWSHLSNDPRGWYAPAAYHANTRKVVFYGGPHTWIWDGACRTWKKVVPPQSPPPRYGWTASPDRDGNVVLFGGSTGANYLDDTWVWDGATWQRETSSPHPPARAFGTSAYDAVRQETILFGGLTAGGTTYYDDTWVWDGSSWTQRTPTTKPSTRAWSTMAADPASGSVILVGGIAGATTTTGNTLLADVWFWDGSVWIESTSQGAPVPRFGAGMAEHPPSHSVVLFGGQDANPGRMMSDTRIWRGTGTEAPPAADPPAC